MIHFFESCRHLLVVLVSYMGHFTELVQTAVPQPKNTFKKHLSIQIVDVY